MSLSTYSWHHKPCDTWSKSYGTKTESVKGGKEHERSCYFTNDDDRR